MPGPRFAASTGAAHCGERGNNGGTIFIATLGAGRREDGIVGSYSIAVDGDRLARWFKLLQTSWPFVLVTGLTYRWNVTAENEIAADALLTGAKALGDVPIETVEVSLDDGGGVPITPITGDTARWQAHPIAATVRIQVRARDARGRQDQDGIQPVSAAGLRYHRAQDGDNRDRGGKWPEKGMLGTQHGPNRNRGTR